MISYDFNGQNLNLINSNGFRNNNLFSPKENFFFYESTKFLWKELMKINTTYIFKSRDISLLEPYVENILYSKLLTDDIDLLSNEYIVQLVTLLQLTGQYLVYTQKRLESENQELTEKINELEENFKENEKFQVLIDTLNRQNQEKDFLIKTYQNMMKGGFGANNGNNLMDNDNSIKLRGKKNDLVEGERKYYFCKICSGKKFISQKYLDEHIQRRHYDQIEIDSEREYQQAREKQSRENNYKEMFDKKLDNLREHFEKLILQGQEANELNSLNKKLDSLRSEIIYQNDARLNNNIIQNGVRIKGPQNFNQMSRPNYYSARNVQKFSNNNNNKESELKDELNKLKEDMNIIKLEMKNHIKSQRMDLQNNYTNSKKNENIIRNNITETTINKKIYNIKETNIDSNNLNRIKSNEIDKNKNKIKENDFQNDFISEENNENINNNMNENNINYNPQNENKNNLNDNQKKFTNKGDDEEKKENINQNAENEKKNQIDANNSLNNNNIFNNDNNEKDKNSDKVFFNSDEEKKEENEHNLLRDKNKNIIEEKNIKEDNDKNGNSIYKKEKNSSANFNKEINENKEIRNGKKEEPKSFIFTFREKVIKRDEDYYKIKNREYEEIKIPSKYKADNEEIESKIKETFEKNNLKESNLDKSNVKSFINDYQNKYKDENIYKKLDLDLILKGYNDYMAEKNKEFNPNIENSIKRKDIDQKYSLKSSNINDSFIPNIKVDDNQNAYSNKHESKNYDINNNVNNNNNITKDIKDSSIFLLEKNYDKKNENEDNKKSIQQSIVIGHDLTKSNF